MLGRVRTEHVGVQLFPHLVSGCQHVGVTKKNIFFHVGEVRTEHVGIQLFSHLVSECQHVGV